MGCCPSKLGPDYPKIEPCSPPGPLPPKELVEKLVKQGFAEADVRSALEISKCNEILAIEILRHLAERAQAGNDTQIQSYGSLMSSRCKNLWRWALLKLM